MKAFAALFATLDRTTSTRRKVEALAAYVGAVPEADAAWAAWLLAGRRLTRLVPAARLWEWTAEESGVPEWLLEECAAAVGDRSELAALLVTRSGEGAADRPLHRWMEETVRPLAAFPAPFQREIVTRAWRALDDGERLVFNKLLTGEFRVGLSFTLVARAVARAAGLPDAVVVARLTGDWEPTAAGWSRIVAPEGEGGRGLAPLPFLLAAPLEGDPAELGDRADWLAEWKWDGIRMQLVRRGGQTALWTRGDELVSPAFPELTRAAAELPPDVVLDGEALAFRDGRPRPFAELQLRLNRKAVTEETLARAPVSFLAFDLLEHDGVDLRPRPLRERRSRLERLLAGAPAALEVSEAVAAPDWEGLSRLRDTARERGVEGLLLKRLDSPYGHGRRRGDWWKWKIAPLTMDAVLVHAQPGHGRRAGIYTDYTFAVWDGGALVTVAKAYSGLTQPEIDELDRWIRAHTVARHGPVREVEPVRVFELAFEAVQRSTRHRAGLAVRFPRILRERTDKRAADADRLETLRALLRDGDPEAGGPPG